MINKEEVRETVLNIAASYPSLDKDKLCYFLTDLAEELENEDLLALADVLNED